MCFGWGDEPKQQQPQQQIQYYPYEVPVPYEVPYFAQPGGGYAPDPMYPLASQTYQDRFNQGGYGYNPNSGMGGGAQGMLTTMPTGGSSVTNIGSDAHMGNIPGAANLLGGGQQNNQSPMYGWF